MLVTEAYRDPGCVREWLDRLRAAVTRPWVVMEVCGGQTHAIVRHGLDELLPAGLTLVHGPGCPVCVTPVELIDRACDLAATCGVILCTFGDMLRVPGSRSHLLGVKAAGGDVRVVYSPLDALTLARQRPDRQVVFFAVGFETTAPTTAAAVRQARRLGLTNFRVLTAHVRVPPALQALLGSPENRVQGFLAAGHVCTVMGTAEYEPVAERFRVPVVVTGFEPLDLLAGLLGCIRMLESGRWGVVNAYPRAVTAAGNPHARAVLDEVFEVTDRVWRGLGRIPGGGYRLRPEYADFDAEALSGGLPPATEPSTRCLSGLVLQGRIKPTDCPAFGTDCTPQTPLGAPMVSGEGACAAYYHRVARGSGGTP